MLVRFIRESCADEKESESDGNAEADSGVA